MKIQEVAKTGMLFRRMGWDDDGIWCNPVREDDIALTSGEGEEEFALDITLGDILADDWMVKP